MSYPLRTISANEIWHPLCNVSSHWPFVCDQLWRREIAFGSMNLFVQQEVICNTIEYMLGDVNMCFRW